jgi:putative peptidoglycan lipid II flippase
VLKVATQLFSGSLFGKLAGIVREMLLASLFGTSGVVAAVRTAQAATFIPVNFFTTDILSAGFLPLYTRYAGSDPERANGLFWFVGALLLVASVIVVGLLVIGAHLWIRVLVPGFGPQEQAHTVDFLGVFAIGVPFYIAGGLLSFREMGHGSYVLVSARATLQSVGMILGTLAAFFLHAPILLAWGFTGAYLVYCVWGLQRAVQRGGALPSSRLSRADIGGIGHDFWKVIKPLLLLPLFLQSSIAVERVIASLLGVDVAAALDYAKFITDTGVLLFAVPLGLASLSVVSRMTEEECRQLVARILPALLLGTIPVSAAIAVHSHLVIALIYQRGAFGAGSTQLTEIILWGFALGLWAQVISYVLLKTLSARLRNAEVFRFMGLALGANMVLDVALYRPLGPVVLGLGSCAYGLVLMYCTAQALKVLEVIVWRVAWLTLGAVGYALCAQALPQEGISAIVSAGAAFAVYWAVFIAVLPLTRRDALELISVLGRRRHAG